VDLSRLNRSRAAIGAIAAILLALTLLFLPWYSLDHGAFRTPGTTSFSTDNFVCGVGDYSCTGFDTFSILKWFLLAGCAAPVILAWVIVRGHKLSWPPGELTMVVGFTEFVLIAYNGIVDKPGSGTAEIGVSLSYGYWIALLCAVAIGAVGFLRSMESGGRQARKAPGTV
jgi:hypothetical protein